MGDAESAESAAAAHRRNLEDEDVGVRHRITNFYGPIFAAECAAVGRAIEETRVLDSGCGNGVSVELLADRGYQAIGVDPWDMRASLWAERRGGTYLVGDGTRLPLADGSVDIVLSSGVLEHIGVIESQTDDYWVRPAPDQRQQRLRFLAECLRVLSPGGVLYLDHPNGAFPVDFWHNDYHGRPRPHSPREQFLPSFREVSALVAEADARYRVEAVSPAGRFLFRRVGRSWYGSLGAAPMEAAFALMRRDTLRWLARTPLNPYLVMRIGIAPPVRSRTPPTTPPARPSDA